MAPTNVPFTKMQGNGNDFVLVDEVKVELVAENLKAAFATWACNRRFGIGADGVLYVVSGRDGADIGMRLLQPDGSEAGMCGNGIRCLARFARDTGHAEPPFSVWTPSGVLPVEIEDEGGQAWVKVEMGQPKFKRGEIPAAGEGEFVEVELSGEVVSAVNTGVPHAVVFVDDFEFDLASRASPIRHSDVFPQGVNVNFVKMEGDGLRVRTFERGVEAETMSCGTGAVAAAAVAHRLGQAGENIVVNTNGGPLRITLTGKTAFMSGHAGYSFEGVAVWASP